MHYVEVDWSIASWWYRANHSTLSSIKSDWQSIIHIATDCYAMKMPKKILQPKFFRSAMVGSTIIANLYTLHKHIHIRLVGIHGSHGANTVFQVTYELKIIEMVDKTNKAIVERFKYVSIDLDFDPTTRLYSWSSLFHLMGIEFLLSATCILIYVCYGQRSIANTVYTMQFVLTKKTEVHQNLRSDLRFRSRTISFFLKNREISPILISIEGWCRDEKKNLTRINCPHPHWRHWGHHENEIRSRKNENYVERNKSNEKQYQTRTQHTAERLSSVSQLGHYCNRNCTAYQHYYSCSFIHNITFCY